MARRKLTLTLTITLDEDAVRADDQPASYDGDSRYSDSLNELRAAVQHHAAIILAPYDPHLDIPEILYGGIDYTVTTD